ncbi:MAG: hypothetical protein HYZ53_03400 [Planctomycetes bacterium]|nr:hypothetical protein [Planctomycetota bacterium]
MSNSSPPPSLGSRLLPLVALVLAVGAAFPACAQEILPLSEVRPGMKGQGKTVFQGARIESFDVEVIDVLRKVFPGEDLILVRVSHPVTDRAGVIAGMSGSPIYLEGKLAGALSYAWGFSKEPIAGVTPIQSMLKEGTRPLEKTGALPPGVVPPATSPTALLPCETPLVLSGFSNRAAAWLEDALRAYRIVPVQGGGGGWAPGMTLPVEPGGAVAVQLIRGDLEASAVGTITHVLGAKVYAFGHPFLGSGETSMPMSMGFVHAVIPSLTRSFKMASSANEIGSLVQDRNACIVGSLERKAHTLPMTVKVKNARTGRESTHRFEVVDHEFLTPPIAASALLSALDVTEDAMGDSTVTSKVSVGLRGYEPVRWTECYSNRARVSAAPFLAPLSRILRDPNERPILESLDFELEVRGELSMAALKNAWWRQDQVRPGSTARLVCLLRPFRGGLETLEVEVPVPADLPPDTTLKVVVAPGPQVLPEVGPATRLRETLELVRRAVPANALVTVVSLPRSRLRMKGVDYASLPNSVLGAWIPGILEEAELANETVRVVTPTPYVLEGAVTLTLQTVK